jgi:uncharacterized cupredoxin-like copper-binding protein
MTPAAPILVFAVVGLVAVVAVAVGFGRQPATGAENRARAILDQRYAAAEMSTKEYDERRAALGDTDNGPHGSPARQRALVVAGTTLLAAVLVLIAMAWAANNWQMPMAGHMGWRSDEPTSASEATLPDADTVAVEAGDLWFEPTELEVHAGEAVNLSFKNTGRVFHDLTITELELDLNAQPGDTATGGLLIDTPGTYQYQCTVPGHAEAGMRGTITAT